MNRPDTGLVVGNTADPDAAADGLVDEFLARSAVLTTTGPV